MTRHLTPDKVEAVCRMIDGWSDRLTWERLVDAVESLLGTRYTRQALAANKRISLAVEVRRKMLDERPVERRDQPDAMRAASQHIERLKATLTRLTAENDLLRGQFARWAYNASLHGMDKEALDRPLPETDRDRTRVRHFDTDF